MFLLRLIECLARGDRETTYASVGVARGLAGGFVPVVGIHDFSARRENGEPPNKHYGDTYLHGCLARAVKRDVC